MSIFSVKDECGGTNDTLLDKLIYIERVSAARMNFIYGAGVSVIDAYNEMMYVKESYGQDFGKGYYHYIFSPEDDEEIDAESFYEMGAYMAECIAHFYGHYQVMVSLHFDTDMHMHFIANNIDIDTGKRMDLGKQELRALKNSLNEILQRYNVSPIRMYYPINILENHEEVIDYAE